VPAPGRFLWRGGDREGERDAERWRFLAGSGREPAMAKTVLKGEERQGIGRVLIQQLNEAEGAHEPVASF
jgi:hypothetical protein